MVCGGVEYSIKGYVIASVLPGAARQGRCREAIPHVMEETAHLHCTERTIC
jgi:hypothetical protein